MKVGDQIWWALSVPSCAGVFFFFADDCNGGGGRDQVRAARGGSCDELLAAHAANADVARHWFAVVVVVFLRSITQEAVDETHQIILLDTT